MTIVSKNKPTMIKPPCLITLPFTSSSGAGLPLVTANDMMVAGIIKLTTAGINNAKNSLNSRMPFCHTINVVISPKGLNAPPAFAPTTMLTQAIAIKSGRPCPTAIITAHITNAVVRLSAIGEMKNAKIPVNQNNAL